jgi:predicted amidohydrolase YtcJ
MPAELAIFDADIRTMDPARPHASAMAVSNGVIVAVGSDDEVRDVCDATTKVLGEPGWAVTPGLTDGHQHLFMGAEIGRGIDFDRVDSLDEIRAMLAAERRRVGPGGWILGFAMEYAALGGLRYHHNLIDAAAGEGPMLVLALDLHTGFTNAAGLDLAGVSGARQFADGSSIVCDDQGHPTGELHERSAIEAVREAMPIAGHDERIGWYRDAIARQNAVGITGVHLMDGGPETADLLEELENDGGLNMRVALHYWVDPATDESVIEAITRGPVRSGRQWRADGVKFMLDGVIDTGTAWLEEPDTDGDGKSPMWPDIEQYWRTVRRIHDAKLRIATHAIGDRAIREVLDVYASLPAGPVRHRIEHIETAPDTTIARFAPEGVIASMQPIHMRWMKPDLSDPWSKRLGIDRCAHGMRSGDLSVSGALMVLGSDWPVAPFDPRLGLFAAQLRRAPDLPDGGMIGSRTALDSYETLAGYTTNAARAIGEDDVAGMLRPGYRADFVAWGEDPVKCRAVDVTELPILATVVDGKLVHRAE